MRYALGALLALLLALPSAGQPSGDPLRIMLIGDSITEGEGGGYRAPLYALIARAIGAPNFVGHRNGRLSDPAAFPDHDHEGYGGYRIDQVMTGGGFWNAPPLETRLADWDPAVVTIHLGTNDAQQNYYPFGDPDLGIPNVVDRLDSLVSRVVAFNPEIYVVVAQIIPANPPARRTTIRYVEELNARVPDVLARHQALGHRVSLVDLYTPMLAHPNPDGIHPNAEGFQVMARAFFEGLRALGVVPENPDQGRHYGVHQANAFSTSTTPPWAPTPNLLRNGSPALAAAVHHGYGGSDDPAGLTDGDGTGAVRDRDNTWTSTYVFDTAASPAGYDVAEIRTYAGGPVEANGDEHAHQAYEVWWSSVNAPTQFVRLGDFHHVIVNDREVASRIVLTRPDGTPLATGVKALQFRFVEPPRRQAGFFEIRNPAHYREVEALGTPSPVVPLAASAAPDALSLDVAGPNPFGGMTALRVALPAAGPARVLVHDALGRRVATLLDGALPTGTHEVRFDAAALPAGVYLVRLEAGGRVLTRTLTRTR